MHLSREKIGKETFWSQTLRSWRTWTRRKSTKTQLKRRLDAPKERKIIFPVADGTAQLSGRDHEFREPTQRQEQPVRSEDLRGELQGEPEEFQPTETKDDSEARGDSWSTVSAYTQVKMDNAPRLLRIPKSECPDTWIRLPRHKWPKSWSQTLKTQWFLVNEILRTSTCRFENVCLFTENNDYS